MLVVSLFLIPCTIRSNREIAGQPFDVEECRGCDLFLADHSAAVNMDACENCHIFIGPVESSVFIRNCTNCRIIVACQQFRMRDCHSCEVLLYCLTEPVIESSKDIRFGCFYFAYDHLAEQFQNAQLSLYHNMWSYIYDFNSNAAQTHYQLLSLKEMTKEPSNFLRKTMPVALLSDDSTCMDANDVASASTSQTACPVPLTVSSAFSKDLPSLVMFVFAPHHELIPSMILSILEATFNEVLCLQSREWNLQPPTQKAMQQHLEECLPASQSDMNRRELQARYMEGAVISLEFSGDDVVHDIRSWVRLPA